MDLKELLNLDKKLIFLENVNGDKIGVLNDIHDVVFSPRFNSISTLSFRVYEDECPYYNQITSWRRIQVQDLMRFIIEKPLESNDGLRKYKEVTCRSLEIDINRYTVPLLSGTFKFYSVLPEDETICSIIMSYLPNWSIESVDSELFNIYRTFDLQNRPLYQLMMEDIENAYECVWEFNTLEQKINIKAFEEIPQKSDVYVSFDNLVNELNITEDTENLITSITVQGANNLAINLVNPLGNTIYNFQHFTTTEFMSQGLIDKINSWQNLIDTKQIDYSNYLAQRKIKLQERINLEVDLVELQGQLRSLTEVRDTLLESGLNATVANTNVKNKQNEINNKQTAIKNKQVEIDNIDLSLEGIQNLVSLKNYFTQSELLELEPFIINISITDENFTKNNLDSDLDIQNTAQDLYDKYKRYLDKASKMRYKFSIDLINFITLEEYKLFTQQLRWGIMLNLETESNGIAYPMLLGLDINLDNENDIQFLFGEDLRYEDSAMSYEDYLSNQLSNVSNTVVGSSVSWGEYVNSGAKDRLNNIIRYGLDLDLTEIKSATNQEIIFDSTGLYGRKLLDIGGYSDKQWKFINNKLMFTKDSWNSAEMAVGEISLPDGSKSYGISANIILGNLLIGNQLLIANSSNTFQVDANGATLKNSSFTIEKGLNKILLNPTNGFKIQKKVGTTFTDMIYLDTDGNAVFKGNIDASKITGSSLNGGSINIGNGNFTVDDTGKVNIKRGSFNIANIFTVDTDGTVSIKKGSLNINSNFIVDQLGNVNMNGTLNIANKLLVDGAGNMTLYGGSISWASSDPKIATAQSTANTALSNAQNAQSSANNAYTLATTTSGNISKLSNGTYTGGTFIDGTTISAPYIEGGRIEGIDIIGSRFYGTSKSSAYAVIGSITNPADFRLYRGGGGTLAFQIYDDLSVIDLYALNKRFLGSSGTTTWAYGTWNFSSATIQGLDTVAKFA